MKKFLRQLLVLSPLLLVICVAVLKWQFRSYTVAILFIGSAVCFVTGLVCVLVARARFKSEFKSLAATVVSLLSMQKFFGFSLVITALLAFTWFMDYVREIPFPGELSELAVAGAVFSASLLFMVSAIVIYFEKQKADQLDSFASITPVKTPHLIIMLSKMQLSEEFEKFKELIPKIQRSPDFFQKNFPKLANYKSRDQLEEIDKDYGEPLAPFIKFILKSKLYPPVLAIFHHLEKLEHLWILVTEDAGKTTLPVFKQILKTLFNWKDYEIIPVADPDDINSVSRVVDTVYTRAEASFKLDEHDVTADITGGTAAMTAGVILACVRRMRRVQYLRQSDFTLRSIDVTVRSIPRLFDELIDKLEEIRLKNDEDNKKS
ncbi:MAG: hypothetical protein GF353_08720 [Candidatus Lokiarchaeota archaeon]|nr:hypothetical protein [Candidatus Lokiarchaeota archaeon]